MAKQAILLFLGRALYSQNETKQQLNKIRPEISENKSSMDSIHCLSLVISIGSILRHYLTIRAHNL